MLLNILVTFLSIIVVTFAMTRYSKPVWQMIKEAVDDLGELTAKIAIEWIDKHYAGDKVNHGTIQAQLIATSVNHPSAHHYMDPNRFLFYIGHGRYRLHDPKTDGVWQITDNGPVLIDKTKQDTTPFARVDTGNRITVPAEIIQELELNNNDVVAFIRENGKIVLRKARLKLDFT
jgi:hypothetical protein